VEEVGSDIDRGPALLGRYLLDQLSQPRGEVSRKSNEPLGATNRARRRLASEPPVSVPR
jgi:hypothetical protein